MKFIILLLPLLASIADATYNCPTCSIAIQCHTNDFGYCEECYKIQFPKPDDNLSEGVEEVTPGGPNTNLPNGWIVFTDPASQRNCYVGPSGVPQWDAPASISLPQPVGQGEQSPPVSGEADDALEAERHAQNQREFVRMQAELDMYRARAAAPLAIPGAGQPGAVSLPRAEAPEEKRQPDPVLIKWKPMNRTKRAPESTFNKETNTLTITGACLGEANGSYNIQDPERMPRDWILEYDRGSDTKTPKLWKRSCDSRPWYLQPGRLGYYICYSASDEQWEIRHPCDGRPVYQGKAPQEAAAQARNRRRAAPPAIPGQPQPDTVWIEWEVQPGRGVKTAPQCILQPDRETDEFTIAGACCGETNGSYIMQDREDTPRNWRLKYIDDGDDSKSPEIWQRNCGSKPWYKNKVGYYIQYRGNKRWELRHPCDGHVVYRGTAETRSPQEAAAAQARDRRRADQARAEQSRQRVAEQQRRQRQEEQRARDEVRRIEEQHQRRLNAKREADRLQAQREHVHARRIAAGLAAECEADRLQLERVKRVSAAEYAATRAEVPTSGGPSEEPAKAPRTNPNPSAPPSVMNNDQAKLREARLKKFGGTPANAGPPPSQPQLHAGQSYLPATIKVIPVDSDTCGVYTDEQGSSCPLLGEYEQMSCETRPRSWLVAHEKGVEAASKKMWKVKLKNRPWYRIKGSSDIFYIRYNGPDKKWCLYDNFDNDNKKRWIYETASTINTDPIGEKWVLQGKCRTCKGTGKRHGKFPEHRCHAYNDGPTRGCNCGHGCEACGVSGKIWEDRIWPFDASWEDSAI